MMLPFLMLSTYVAEAQPEVDVSFRMMTRPQVRLNPDFNADTTYDNTWSIQQSSRLSAKGTWDGLVVKVAANDGRDWGSTASTLNMFPSVTLYEGYVQVGTKDNKTSWLRIGRQEYYLHDGRHFFYAGWNIYGRTFDAVRYHGEKGTTTWDVTGIILGDSGVYTSTCADSDPTDNVDDCADFSPTTETSVGDIAVVANAEVKVSSALKVQPYVIVLREDAAEGNLERDRLVMSPSLRMEGKPSEALSYIVEGAYQFGRASASADHAAWMAAAKVKYRTEQFGVSTWYEENSGDGDPTDGVDNNYEAFWGAFHRFRGYADQVGPSNSRDIGVGVSVPLPQKITLTADAHLFQLSNPAGTWFGATKNPVGAAPVGNDEALLGEELDVNLVYKPKKGVKFNLGYSWFNPDGVGAEIGGEDSTHFTYLWMIVKK